ncbi:carboxylesterase [Parvularcula sp. IMCC14364]|uniref:alpha/beta hydrolase n=1 Tax=Parvularcula sp. IMCC14364 TaxID=3067902 RepID=UPI00274091A9|nr:alpha/beta hydrolase [Parvularcula sp. IMCC14364]
MSDAFITDRTRFLKRPGKPDIAWRKTEGEGTGIIWLGGYASDMAGTKADYLSSWARSMGRPYLRFDYSGHGESGGYFEDGCISDWADDALCVLDQLTEGPQILIGSSMGGWITCLLARQRPERLAGLLFIAPAPDFTDELMWPSWDKATQQRLLSEGKLEFPSEYDESVMIYTRRLYEDGKSASVFAQPLKVNVPVRILQGMNDTSVPWQHAARLAEHIEAGDLQITMIKGADHRMSGPADLARLAQVLESL